MRISFSVTPIHSVPMQLNYPQGVNLSLTSQRLCINFGRICIRHSLMTGRLATAGDCTPICCLGGIKETISPPSRNPISAWTKVTLPVTGGRCVPARFEEISLSNSVSNRVTDKFTTRSSIPTHLTGFVIKTTPSLLDLFTYSHLFSHHQ